ncbi:helix-turn-helix domain-containing protein [Niveispirillum sp. KHB5.9]|uniref:AraC family transcriptional regulator n=1 Tax=Niveispirillum sp. KHB5.9 TaxID=3400269 RepID=UPI003A84D9F9
MDTHSFIDFQSDRLPRGIQPLHRVRHDGYVIGRYLLDECADAKLGSPQLTLIQHDGPSFTLRWHPVDQVSAIQHRVKPGQIHLTPPERIIQVSWSGRQPVFIVALDVGFITGPACEGTIEILDSMPTQLDIQDTRIGHILEILKEGLEQSASAGTLTLACVLLVGRLLEIFGSKPMPPAVNGGLGVSRQRRILSYIDAHLQDDLTLERLAAEIDLSPDHFGRAFRASLGVSPLRYIAQRRLQRAKALLLDPGMSITDIAMALGFATASHFTSNFHKATGTTPSQWRRDRR